VLRGREERSSTLKVRVLVLRYAALELGLPIRTFMNICLEVDGVATRTFCCAIHFPGAPDLG
jgi:hypothetical protein